MRSRESYRAQQWWYVLVAMRARRKLRYRRSIAIRNLLSSPSWALSVFIVASCAGSPDGLRVRIPGGEAGIGFDDLRYSPSLHRVLAPAGRAGTLALVDPGSGRVLTVGGFSATSTYDGSHDFGPTSVDEGNGLLFVTDRSSQKLSVVDAIAGTIVTSLALAANPDYARFVAATNEVWISEPSSSQIEVVTVSPGNPPSLSSAALIGVANGPESLVIDQRAGRARAHPTT